MMLVPVDRLEELRSSHPHEPVNLYIGDPGKRLVIGGELSSAILFVYRLVHDHKGRTGNGAAHMRDVLRGCRFKLDDDAGPLLILPGVLVVAE